MFINNILPISNKNRKVNNTFGKYTNIQEILTALPKAKNIKVVVAGGFHTNGLSKILNDNKISNFTITPNIKSKDTSYEKKYKDSILLQTNIYRNAIAGEPLYEQDAPLFINNFINAYKNADVATRFSDDTEYRIIP